jgi:predicted restriction endonuclease
LLDKKLNKGDDIKDFYELFKLETNKARYFSFLSTRTSFADQLDEYRGVYPIVAGRWKVFFPKTAGMYLENKSINEGIEVPSIILEKFFKIDSLRNEWTFQLEFDDIFYNLRLIPKDNLRVLLVWDEFKSVLNNDKNFCSFFDSEKIQFIKYMQICLRHDEKTYGASLWKHEIKESEKFESKEIEKTIEADIDSEKAEDESYYKDGAVKEYYGRRYERNPENRKKAIELHGLDCVVCGFNFEKVYGERGKGFIEVHHIKPLSTLEKEMVIDPEQDLVPVCSNCHRMIHRRKDDVLTVEELRSTLIKIKMENMY